MGSWSFEDLDVGELRAKRGIKWTRYGEDVLAAWVADMDFPTPPCVQRAIAEVVDRADYGYPSFYDHDPVPEAFSARMADRFGWEPDPSLVVVMADVLQGIQACIQLWSEPGDGIAIQTPIYPPFLGVVANNGRRLVDNPLGAAGGGARLDLDGLRARVIDERTRILLLCNPHNPLGRAFERAKLEALAALALERDLLIVSDEIHEDLVYEGHDHIPIASLGPDVAARTVTLTAATKSFNIAGLRCAVGHFGTPELLERYRTIPRHLLGGTNTLGPYASVAGWAEGQPWLDDLMAHLDGNRRHLVARVAADLPGIECHLPEATYLAWLDCRALDLSASASEFFLAEARVALNNGADFGEHGVGFARLNFATSRAILDEIIDRMADALSRRG